MKKKNKITISLPSKLVAILESVILYLVANAIYFTYLFISYIRRMTRQIDGT
jgi:hypothetical protein